ncbi:MAG TPA: sodium:proton antiporter, partial [Xanthobacteraceae bacterium]|nr:sodium:proton antiporter [Xanthobacteraceae bacterium]
MRRVSLTLSSLIAPAHAHAATLDGAAMSLAWALPFAGLLLTIATGPTLFRTIWHAHYGKLALGWAALVLLPLALAYGASASIEALVHVLLGEYLSFIVLLFALYTVAGGILVSGNLRGTPASNTTILAFGTLIASVVGTTGAAMILIRPVIAANLARVHRAHVIVFF